MNLLDKLLKAPALLAAIVFAVGGGGFVIATLILARVLPEDEFGHAVLIIALCNVAVAAGPAAVNGIALRHDRRCDRKLLAAGGICVAATGGIAAALGALWYSMDRTSTLVLLLASIAGGLTLLTRSAFQRSLALQRMAILYQIPNIALLAASLVMLAGAGHFQWFPTLMVGMCHVLVGVYAWRWVRRHQKPGRSIDGSLWPDAAALGSLSLSSETMMQLERLVLPMVLGSSELALFAVIAAVALTPYRMLEMGTITTLIARLRAASSPAARLRLFRKEVQLLVGLSVVCGIAVAVIAPALSRVALGEGQVSFSLILAIGVSGTIRVISALTHSSATAFCEGRELQVVNVGNWIAVVIGALMGAVLSRFGLEGLIYGVAIGWLFRAALSGYIGARHFRSEGGVVAS